jgi:hypothetical protein
MSSTASTNLRAVSLPPCDHDGTCSGMLSFLEGQRVMAMRIVCDVCGAHVGDLGEIVYELSPRLGSVLRAA